MWGPLSLIRLQGNSESSSHHYTQWLSFVNIQSWIFIGRTDVEAETPILGHLMRRTDSFEKNPWCWERLKAGGEGDNRGWDGWMALLTQRTWVWVNSGSWWWTGKPGVLQSMGSQRVRHDRETELNWSFVKHHVPWRCDAKSSASLYTSGNWISETEFWVE